jgi:hypothetical protein
MMILYYYADELEAAATHLYFLEGRYFNSGAVHEIVVAEYLAGKTHECIHANGIR